VLFEHLQARSTIELALDRLQAVDLPFNDPLTVPTLTRRGNCREVPTDALDEAQQIGQVGLLGVLKPLLQSRPLSLTYDLHKARQVLVHLEQIRTALILLLEASCFSSGTVRGIFATPPAEPAGRHGPLPMGQHRGSEYGMEGRTPFATRLGAPWGQVAPQIVKGSAKSLRLNRYAHIVLSGFPLVPQIGHILIDFAGAFSWSTSSNRIGALGANHGAPRNAQQTGIFRLGFALPGVLLHPAIPLRSVLRASVLGGPIGGRPAGRPRQSHPGRVTQAESPRQSR
jgi:hypothetical protein